MTWRNTGWLRVVFAVLIAICSTSSDAFAQVPQSTNYRFDESVIGSSSLEASSTNFQARSAAGDLSVGEAASANFQVEAGSQTTNDPVLSFEIPTGDITLGSFSPTSATVGTSTFSISNYTSYGYVVYISGTSPSDGAHSIDALSTNSVSQIGTEQYGINLVANTSPVSVGANPDNGDYGFGVVSANYNTPNEFRFVSGEQIASAPESSGVTTYTITYLVNVEGLTPGGQYSADQTIVVTGTY